MRAGFTPETVEVEDYRAIPLRRGRGRLGLLDLRGILTVDDPTRFIERLAQGFGRARAFGCGLMLIRRAG
jgi:CRISPR system Cascade subunit CasE